MILGSSHPDYCVWTHTDRLKALERYVVNLAQGRDMRVWSWRQYHTNLHAPTYM